MVRNAWTFARGVAEMAAAIRENRPSRLSAQFSLHVNEIALAIHYAREQGSTYQMTTTFDPVEPASWAQEQPQAVDENRLRSSLGNYGDWHGR